MIALVLSQNSIDENLKSLEKNAQYIDIAELRLDLLSPDEQKKAKTLPSLTSIPLILTLRKIKDGGKFDGTEKERKKLLLDALEGDFKYIDLEEEEKKDEVEIRAKEKNVKIIRSSHNFDGISENIVSKVKKLKKRGDIAKLALFPKSMKDTIEIFKASRELEGIDKILLGMGEFGVPTRILYKKLGSFLTFTSEDVVAPGQFSPKGLKELYRADKVDEETEIFGIVGNPVLHTSSPKIHNPAFLKLKLNAIYLPFPSDNIKDFLSLAELIKIKGFSVTIPFKVDVLSFLGNITREVKQIGSCNTVIRKENMWKGINTDYYGFLEPILKTIKKGKIKNALVLGAGGASNAVVWGLRNTGVKVTILNRTISKAEELAKLNFCSFDNLENAKEYENKVDLIVQTTSVGLSPNFGTSPIEDFKFSGKEIAYDIIYKPKWTKFLLDAKEAGCLVHFGSEMLLEQGKLQFEEFTSLPYPKSLDPDLN